MENRGLLSAPLNWLRKLRIDNGSKAASVANITHEHSDALPQQAESTENAIATGDEGAGQRMAHAEQETRLLSALVLLLGVGIFMALPFLLSIGSVVFLPLVAALVMTVILSPIADRLAAWGLPNVLASLAALLSFFFLLLLALGLILQPAVALFDDVPAMVDRVGQRFNEVQMELRWISEIQKNLGTGAGDESAREVVLAGPSLLEELAFGAPSVVLEVLLTFLMAFFMIESRVRLRQRLLVDRSSFGSSIKAARVMREIQDRVAAYIFTVAWINAGVGVVAALGAWALGVEAPIMWGGLAALLNFIPYVGPMVMTVLLALFGLGTADTLLLGMVPAAAYLGLHTIESNAVTPAILGARFTMNPVMILIALSYFSWIWGVPGALLSIPILLMLTALFDHIGRPNLVGFIFGEPLFNTGMLEDDENWPN